MGKSNLHWRQGIRHLALMGGIFVASAAAHAVPVFDRMVLFGDSLSDTGNTRNALGAIGTIPSVANGAGYGSNGRFSNGPVWHETLAPLIGVPVNTASRVAGSNNYNYAYGGARVDNDSGQSAGVLKQYSDYSSRIGAGGSDPNSLYVLWAGGNDVRDVVGSVNPMTNITNSINALQSVLTGLISSGAETFLIPNLPDLGKIPENRGSASEASATSATQLWNASLLDMVLDLSSQASFYFLDVYSEFNNLLDNPASYGFNNTTGQCRSVGGFLGSSERSCTNANTWVFWDNIHPTTAAHGVLAQAAFRTLDGPALTRAVPEPSTVWLLALALPGLLLLRRQRPHPVASSGAICA